MHGSADPSKHSRVVDRDKVLVRPSTTGPSPPAMDSNSPCYFKIVSTFKKVKPIPVRLFLKVLPCGLVCIVGRFRRPSRGMQAIGGLKFGFNFDSLYHSRGCLQRNSRYCPDLTKSNLCRAFVSPTSSSLFHLSLISNI